MRLVSIIAAIALTACASGTQVKSMPEGRFLVTGLATAQEGGAEASRNKALSMATRYCGRQRMRPEVLEISTSGSESHGVAATDVEFLCVSHQV